MAECRLAHEVLKSCFRGILTREWHSLNEEFRRVKSYLQEVTSSAYKNKSQEKKEGINRLARFVESQTSHFFFEVHQS